MTSADLLNAANRIVGILGVAAADPVVAAAASGSSAAFSMQGVWHRLSGQTDSLAERIAADLTQELTLHQLPTQIRQLIPPMLAEADLAPGRIMAAARDPAAICALLLNRMEDPAHKAQKAGDGFTRVVTAVLARHLGDPATRAHLRPVFDDAIAATLQHVDRQVEDLVARARDDAHRLGVQDGMLNALARRYAPDDTASVDAALAGLKVALDTAMRMTTRDATPQDSGPVAALVIAEVNRLNALDQMAQADTLIAMAEQALDGQTPQRDAQLGLLHSLGLDQARLLAAPDRAAARILADLTRRAPASGMFRAIHDAWEDWFDRGNDTGIGFDLTTALLLARANLGRSKGVLRRQALGDLGITQYNLGEKAAGAAMLTQAIATFRSFLAEHPRKSDPENWATGKTNLGLALQTLGKRETGTRRLEEAVTAFRAALEVQTRDRAPLDWAGTLGNMAEAMVLLADRTDDLALAVQALAHLSEAEAVLQDGGHGPGMTHAADRIPRANAVIARLS